MLDPCAISFLVARVAANYVYVASYDTLHLPNLTLFLSIASCWAAGRPKINARNDMPFSTKLTKKFSDMRIRRQVAGKHFC